MIRLMLAAVSTGMIATASQGFAQDVEIGSELYQHYCATCHGIDATGHGPMAGILVIQPTDLTQLSAADGVFPTARVVARIDGRDLEALVEQELHYLKTRSLGLRADPH